MPEFTVKLADDLAEVLVAVARCGLDGLHLPFGDEANWPVDPDAVSRANLMGLTAVSGDWGGERLDRRIYLTPIGAAMVRPVEDGPVIEGERLTFSPESAIAALGAAQRATDHMRGEPWSPLAVTRHALTAAFPLLRLAESQTEAHDA